MTILTICFQLPELTNHNTNSNNNNDNNNKKTSSSKGGGKGGGGGGGGKKHNNKLTTATNSSSSTSSLNRHICQMNDDCTVMDLFNQAHDIVVVRTTSTTTNGDNNNNLLKISSLKFGFPPRIIELNSSNEKQMIKSIGIQNQERIIISVVQEEQQQKQSSTTSNEAGKLDATTINPSVSLLSNTEKLNDQQRPSKRKAAIIASESFHGTIAVMKQMEKQEQKGSKNGKKNGATTVAKPASSILMSESKKTAAATARHFRNLETMHPITSTTSNTVDSISSSSSPPRRLKDGAVVVVPSHSSSTRGTKRKGSHLDFLSTTTTTKSKSKNTSTSIEEALLVATTSSNTKGARLLRQGWRTAVNSMYEQNQAVARLASIQHQQQQGHTVTFRVSAHKFDPSKSTLYVKYPKGVQGRSNQYYEDIIPELIDIPVLQSVISSLYNASTSDDTNPEAFRPTNLSLLSPRVFWSLVYHYEQNQNSMIDGGTNQGLSRDSNNDDVVMKALEWIQPNLSWKYLRRRPTKLSAKAMENIRQQQQKEDDKHKKETNYFEAAALAIAAVEDAMENMYDNVHTLRDSNDRFMNDDDKIDESVRNYVLVTPTEEDIDELIECIQNGTEDETIEIPMDHRNKMAQCLMKQCHIHNWRELANAESDSIYTTVLDTDKDTNLSMDDIEKWIDYAQQQSLYEIMYEICDSNDPYQKNDVIELLQNGVNSGTPKDLAMWYPIIPQLQKELEHYYQNQILIDSDEEKVTGTPRINLPSYNDLKKWSYKCQRVLEQLDWLNDYVTPVE